MASGDKTSELAIPCPEADCDLVFPSVDALRAHKKEVHARPSSRKLLSCTECEQTFAEEEELSAHMAKDHCALAYACPTCGELFLDAALLLGHMSNHCKEEEEQEYIEEVV